jgi:lysophospholipase L1-like esterase
MRFILFLSLIVGARGAEFYLHPNDVVVFYGDSITDQRLYTTYVETFVVTRYPKLPVRFVHSGWGGDRVTGGGGGPVDTRLDRDVLAYKPTVMTVMLGMNDGRYKAFDDDTYRVFTDGYEHIVKRMKDAIPSLLTTT